MSTWVRTSFYFILATDQLTAPVPSDQGLMLSMMGNWWEQEPQDISYNTTQYNLDTIHSNFEKMYNINLKDL